MAAMSKVRLAFCRATVRDGVTLWLRIKGKIIVSEVQPYDKTCHLWSYFNVYNLATTICTPFNWENLRIGNLDYLN